MDINRFNNRVESFDVGASWLGPLAQCRMLAANAKLAHANRQTLNWPGGRA